MAARASLAVGNPFAAVATSGAGALIPPNIYTHLTATVKDGAEKITPTERLTLAMMKMQPGAIWIDSKEKLYGPVGSPTKIDCSYLSPEVKISDRLEAATKIYSSNILMSGQFYDQLSDHIKVGIRLIDRITLKGGHKPFRVYADDRSNLWLKMNPRLQ